MARLAFILGCVCSCILLQSGQQVLAWGYQGHEVVGAIADELIKDNANASRQVHDILNSPLPSTDEIKEQKDLLPGKRDLTLQQAGPWADCVKAVTHHDGDRFKYELDPAHPEYETPCIPFNSALERARMEDYVKHNWSTPDCSYHPFGHEQGCHNTYHFDDVAIQRDSYDRSDLGTSSHDVVSAINAAIAVLTDKTPPPPFVIRDKKMALLLLTHFVGDLHQPLHVGAVYLDPLGGRVDPDAAHQIDPATETAGGNSIQDGNVVLHAEWDDIPFDIGLKATDELLQSARAVPADSAPMDGWAASWATDTMQVAHEAFKDLTFCPKTDEGKWPVSFADHDQHMAYLHRMDEIKRQQLAKAGARLAEILNTIWPKN